VPRQADSVLLVEDDLDLSRVEALALGAEGYKVQVAHDGRAALEQIAHERPSVILLDMSMPGMNGWQFMAAFRAAYGHDIPVLVVTAADNAERRALDVGAEDWLAKPFELDDLLSKVARHARHTTGGSPPTGVPS
jgi:DNA-binding response OmpR family regulator